jgi:hypothetical protein
MILVLHSGYVTTSSVLSYGITVIEIAKNDLINLICHAKSTNSIMTDKGKIDNSLNHSAEVELQECNTIFQSPKCSCERHPLAAWFYREISRGKSPILPINRKSLQQYEQEMKFHPEILIETIEGGILSGNKMCWLVSIYSNQQIHSDHGAYYNYPMIETIYHGNLQAIDSFLGRDLPKDYRPRCIRSSDNTPLIVLLYNRLYNKSIKRLYNKTVEYKEYLLLRCIRFLGTSVGRCESNPYRILERYTKDISEYQLSHLRSLLDKAKLRKELVTQCISNHTNIPEIANIIDRYLW